MFTSRFLAFCLATLLVLPGCRTMFDAVDAATPDYVERISYMDGDSPRDVIITYPASITAQRRLPVIIHLHGTLSDAEQEMASSGIDQAAAHMGFIAVYPQASGPEGWDLAGDGDTAFLEGVMGELVREHRADPQRIYISGVGNGGAMALKMACDLSHAVAGTGVVSAALPMDSCRTVRPLPVVMFHGLGDPLVPFAGGATDPSVGLPDEVPSISDIASMLAERNGCEETPMLSTRGELAKEAYSGDTRQADVILYIIQNGGHGWPEREEGEPGVNLAWIMLDFFSQR